MVGLVGITKTYLVWLAGPNGEDGGDDDGMRMKNVEVVPHLEAHTFASCKFPAGPSVDGQCREFPSSRHPENRLTTVL